jgi:hypothetical protein
LSFDARLGIRSRNLPPSSSRLNRGYSKAPRGAGRGRPEARWR